ncbi:MAG: hypothetical protein IPO07_09755 [Haliscomenobacter sp.]|nr:hypothetical protein [Haliscomenobacter sp.]MBK9489045.1 hypothetical protein [Haliscomenobacter sp.]
MRRNLTTRRAVTTPIPTVLLPRRHAKENTLVRFRKPRGTIGDQGQAFYTQDTATPVATDSLERNALIFQR